MGNVIIHDFAGSLSAQIFSIVMHAFVVWVGMTLVRGYWSVFKSHPSNIAFAMVMLLSSMVTTSIILGLNSFMWFFGVCLFCELNSHFAWIQILWTGFYATGLIMLYMVLKRKIGL